GENDTALDPYDVVTTAAKQGTRVSAFARAPSVPGHLDDLLSIGGETEWPSPLACLAIEEPENEHVGLAPLPDPDDGFQIAVEEVAVEGALNEGAAAREAVRRIAEVAQVMPPRGRFVVVAEVLADDIALRHQQFVVPVTAPGALYHHGIAGDIAHLLAVGA